MNGLPLGLVAVPGRHDTVDEQEHGQEACCGAAGDMRSGCAEKLTGVQTRTLRKQTCVRRVLVGSSLPEDSEGKCTTSKGPLFAFPMARASQLAVAAGIASIAAGVVWYINRRATAPTATATTSDPREPATVAPERVESQIEEHDPLEPTTVAGPTRPRSVSWNPEESRSERSAGARSMPATNITAYGADLCALRGAPATGHAGEVPAYAPNDCGCTHILALPAEIIALILASKPLRAAFYAPHLGRDWVLEQLTIGQALARKPFAICVREAATIVAGRNGWLLPVAGSTPMLRLSKLEDDTERVRSILRDDVSWWSATTIGYDRERPGIVADRLLQFVAIWSQEVSRGFIGPLIIDPQVRRQHTMELGGLLIKLGMAVCACDRRRDIKLYKLVRSLIRIMMQPDTPLNASWLALRVVPLVKKHMDINGDVGAGYEDKYLRRSRLGLIDLLGYLEPQMLRRDIETFGWLHRSLKRIYRREYAGGVWVDSSETMWNAGLKAWNERCEAHGLELGGRGNEKLDAMMDSQVRGCFVSLSALGRPHSNVWSTTSTDIFHAVYHEVVYPCYPCY